MAFVARPCRQIQGPQGPKRTLQGPSRYFTGPTQTYRAGPVHSGVLSSWFLRLLPCPRNCHLFRCPQVVSAPLSASGQEQPCLFSQVPTLPLRLHGWLWVGLGCCAGRAAGSASPWEPPLRLRG